MSQPAEISSQTPILGKISLYTEKYKNRLVFVISSLNKIVSRTTIFEDRAKRHDISVNRI